MAMRRPWGPDPSLARQLHSALPWSGLEWCLWCFIFSVSALAGETVFSGKGKCVLQARGELAYTYRQKSPPLLWLVHPHENETPNPHSLIGPKGTALIGQWRCWWGYSHAALFEWGTPQSYWLKYYPRISFIRADSDVRNTVQVGSSVWEADSLVQTSPWSVGCVRGPWIEMAARLCFQIWAPVATRSPSW